MKKRLLITGSTFPRYENDTEPRFILDLAKYMKEYAEVTVLVPAAPKAAAPVAAPKASGAAGSVKVEAGAAGKVFKIEANVGQAVKKGDAVVIIEAMKMENDIVAPCDGTVASVAAKGTSVNTDDVLATLS